MKKSKTILGIIYIAENTITGQKYIGATTNGIQQRKWDHEERAARDNDGKFGNAIATYGPEAFKWEQIDTANDINELAAKEKEYIFKYKAKEGLYNSDCGGGFQKDIYQYSLEDGSLLNSYDSLESAAVAVGASRTSISNACLGYNKSCMGFYWSYLLRSHYLPGRDRRKKRVFQFSLTGKNIAQYNSVAEASRSSGLSKTCISRCCRGERDHSGGYIWKYI